MTITVLYSCVLCGLDRATCVVPARADEDVRVWMDQTIRVVAADHAHRSPTCTAQQLSNLMIPMTGADRIGGLAVQ